MKINHEQLKWACEIAEIAIWSLDLSTSIVHIEGNPQYEYLTRIEPQAPLLEHLTIMHPDDVGLVMDQVSSLTEEHPFLDVKFRVVGSDGHTYWNHAKGKLAKGTTMVYGVVADVTQQQALEDYYSIALKHTIEIKDQIRSAMDELEKHAF